MDEPSDAPATKSESGPVAGVRRLIEWVLSTKPARAFLLYNESKGPKLADSVTYRTLFSLFAGVFLGFAIAGLWLAGNPDAMDALIDALDAAIPGLVGTGALIDPDDLVQPLTFGIAGSIALIGLIGTAIGAIDSLRVAFRTIAAKPDSELFVVWRMLLDLATAVGFGLLLAASAAVTAGGTILLGGILDLVGVGPNSPVVGFATQSVSVIVTFAIDAVVIAGLFRVLSGVRAKARDLWSGAILGGIGLTVLQVLSSLFVGGARSNPLLASFGTLIALLIWLNLSAQVILIASAYIVTGVEERVDRVAERYGARSMALRKLRRAERLAKEAGAEVLRAREAVERVKP
ncbi:YihY/virulence factor BrkB family protein [Agromyces intestinalis]|uniref:YihY/virulence factor BrkB family protein n=1 Tax=Agromyces intestinalis TaxID=2592652 RepID=A0A5C1YB43_9MICO|nr:YihY/virulence factor BrkB family protein [Agromyces intestinalis]QEO13221.1 YihY/virulence factor BrkB family protein [Agromyces intestinalis]